MTQATRYVYALAAALLMATGCGEFETRSIILDLRIMAVNVEPPEVVVPVVIEDLAAAMDDPDVLAEILADIELPDVQVCALVGDPAESRALEFTMSACAPNDHKRCDEPDRPAVDFATGTVEDPEEADAPVSICGTLAPSLDLFLVLQDVLLTDPLGGLNGLNMQIQFTVRGAGEPFATAEYAAKIMVYSINYPEGKLANSNPRLDAIGREIGDDLFAGMPLGRCADVAPFPLAPGETIILEPIEPLGTREDYVVPTFDGSFREFTENLTYAWYATDGRFNRELSGGPRDVAGNPAEVQSEWTAPADADTASDVSLWLVQRDERGGLSWYESCVRVDPTLAQ